MDVSMLTNHGLELEVISLESLEVLLVGEALEVSLNTVVDQVSTSKAVNDICVLLFGLLIQVLVRVGKELNVMLVLLSLAVDLDISVHENIIDLLLGSLGDSVIDDV